ncbi:hypothetical protein RR46_14542 [Papilio xuthus]|uniref:Uncharacterized protein n=1 Tax=Papilio xuthus TaxID=66420 RepID=A0A194PDF1_PAPXU|nr:hypothetical protein RR46_14542 [Papilio xuthus]
MAKYSANDTQNHADMATLLEQSGPERIFSLLIYYNHLPVAEAKDRGQPPPLPPAACRVPPAAESPSLRAAPHAAGASYLSQNCMPRSRQGEIEFVVCRASGARRAPRLPPAPLPAPRTSPPCCSPPLRHRAALPVSRWPPDEMDLLWIPAAL